MKKFSREAMELYLYQHYLLKDKVLAKDEETINELQIKILETFSSLHKVLIKEDPHIRAIVGLGGNFKNSKDTFLMKYSVFCRRKMLFEYPDNLVSFIPPDFHNFKQFAYFANQLKDDIL
jgi:hypothetical protein